MRRQWRRRIGGMAKAEEEGKERRVATVREMVTVRERITVRERRGSRGDGVERRGRDENQRGRERVFGLDLIFRISNEISNGYSYRYLHTWPSRFLSRCVLFAMRLRKSGHGQEFSYPKNSDGGVAIPSLFPSTGQLNNDGEYPIAIVLTFSSHPAPFSMDVILDEIL
ncbi:hypothetical protein Syun_003528 [Stephania yunnanensis]|uniref:Uncharacterized protein n=1 Tax=Stephania yunnanensis TaxID=152371 RepID=A0AAP0Q3Z6_9MAGN